MQPYPYWDATSNQTFNLRPLDHSSWLQKHNWNALHVTTILVCPWVKRCVIIMIGWRWLVGTTMTIVRNGESVGYTLALTPDNQPKLMSKKITRRVPRLWNNTSVTTHINHAQIQAIEQSHYWYSANKIKAAENLGSILFGGYRFASFSIEMCNHQGCVNVVGLVTFIQKNE